MRWNCCRSSTINISFDVPTLMHREYYAVAVVKRETNQDWLPFGRLFQNRNGSVFCDSAVTWSVCGDVVKQNVWRDRSSCHQTCWIMLKVSARFHLALVLVALVVGSDHDEISSSTSQSVLLTNNNGSSFDTVLTTTAQSTPVEVGHQSTTVGGNPVLLPRCPPKVKVAKVVRVVVMLPRLETCPNNDPRDVVYYTHMEQVLPAVWLATNVKNNYSIDYRHILFSSHHLQLYLIPV